MSTQLYKQYPDLYCYNSETKRHMLKASPKFKRLFKTNPEQFTETRIMFPPGPATLPPVVEIKEKQPDIGTLPPLTEKPPTPAQLEQQLTSRMREKVHDIVETELKANPAPYVNVKTPDLEAMLRALIIKKLGAETIKPGKKSKASAAKPIFKVHPPNLPDSEESGSDFDSDDED